MYGFEFRPTHLSGVLVAALLTFPASAEHVPAGSLITGDHGAQLVIPIMNSGKGKVIFVDKGCVQATHH